MSNPDVSTFLAVAKRVEAKEITKEQGMVDVSKLNYENFSIDDIKCVQDAKWLSPDFSVDIMKRWIRKQDQIILQIRASLFLSPIFAKDTVNQYIEAAQNPSSEVNMKIENVIEKLATTGGTRPYINPMLSQLIQVESLSETLTTSQKLFQLFEKGIENCFVSQASQNQYIIVSLPPFLKLQVTSYKLGSPPEIKGRKSNGGMMSWLIQGSNDKSNFVNTIDNVVDNKDLADPGIIHEFQIPHDKVQGFYNHFKITQTANNHQNNASIYLSFLDFSGNLIISSE